MSWNNLPTDPDADLNFDNYMERLTKPIPEPPPPDMPIKTVDLATESETPKTYIPKDEKPFQDRKAAGVSKVSEPVNVYEPGFRTDVYDGLIKFFRERNQRKRELEKLRDKIGLR